MDRQTRHEFDRLMELFTRALDGVRTARDDEEELAGWRRVQVAGWELNALLPRSPVGQPRG